MTRQLEKVWEDRQRRREKALVAAVEYGLKDAVERSGAEFFGFAAKCNPEDCLLTVKGVLAGRRQVCFVGAADLGSALVKAVRLGNSDKLVWKEDKYGG